MVPQVWLRVFISPFTVHCQLFFGLPLLRLPFGAQSTSTCSSWWWSPSFPDHNEQTVVHLRWCWTRRFSGFSAGSLCGKWRACCARWKSSLKHFRPYNRVKSTQLWYTFSFVFVRYAGPPKIVEHSEDISGLAKLVFNVVDCSSITSNSSGLSR